MGRNVVIKDYLWPKLDHIWCEKNHIHQQVFEAI